MADVSVAVINGTDLDVVSDGDVDGTKNNLKGMMKMKELVKGDAEHKEREKKEPIVKMRVNDVEAGEMAFPGDDGVDDCSSEELIEVREKESCVDGNKDREDAGEEDENETMMEDGNTVNGIDDEGSNGNGDSEGMIKQNGNIAPETNGDDNITNFASFSESKEKIIENGNAGLRVENGESEDINDDSMMDTEEGDSNVVLGVNEKENGISEIVGNGIHKLGDEDGEEISQVENEVLVRKRLAYTSSNGECSGNASSALDNEEILSQLNVPVKLPDIVEIKRALPAHCFVPSVMTSLYFMVKDFTLVAIIYMLAEWSWRFLPPVAQLVVTPLVWLLQGVIFTGIFVVGHDAGHGSFSSSSWINDICGNICHSFLFCPYFMWKLSHRNHHKNTANMDKEEVYYPVRQQESQEFYNSLLPGFGLGLGWFTYLWQGYRPRGVDHYNPFHPMFRRHVVDCLISMAFLALWAFCLYQYFRHFGLIALVYHWVIPVLVFGSFIVIITFLHHSDVEVPWYSDNLWSYVRGQLSSVDRHYGWCHHLIHHIGTHQIHHLFPVIPHYHLEEATAAFRQKFPALVRSNNEAILPAFYKMFWKYATQNIIADDRQVHVYK